MVYCNTRSSSLLLLLTAVATMLDVTEANMQQPQSSNKTAHKSRWLQSLLPLTFVPETNKDLKSIISKESTLSIDCGVCDYQQDEAMCRKCLEMEHLIVKCGDFCFYSNECFAIQAGRHPDECQIVGTDNL